MEMAWISKFFKNKAHIYDLGEGMELHTDDHGVEKSIYNSITGEKFLIIDKSKNVIGIKNEHINFKRVDLLENTHNATKLYAPYGFEIGYFQNGVSMLSWTLYPDGRYFEDEDGFGGENCNETTVYAFINTNGKIVIPFRDMNEEEKNMLRKEAELIELRSK